MQKKIINSFLMVVMGFLVFSACTSDVIEPASTTVLNPADTIKFATQIQPIFTNHCASCHSPGGPQPVLKEGQSYQSLKSGNFINTTSPEQSIIYTVMKTGGSMHGYTNDDQANLVLAWIKQGALDN